mmetsp:Transcript_18160/g.49835  ORF Transcript_18160/g.49835 Transcript_18160/m.49835 type:complete len:304 (-) Transcript_18160:247-1158(-)
MEPPGGEAMLTPSAPIPTPATSNTSAALNKLSRCCRCTKAKDFRTARATSGTCSGSAASPLWVAASSAAMASAMLRLCLALATLIASTRRECWATEERRWLGVLQATASRTPATSASPAWSAPPAPLGDVDRPGVILSERSEAIGAVDGPGGCSAWSGTTTLVARRLSKLPAMDSAITSDNSFKPAPCRSKQATLLMLKSSRHVSLSASKSSCPAKGNIDPSMISVSSLARAPLRSASSTARKSKQKTSASSWPHSLPPSCSLSDSASKAKRIGARSRNSPSASSDKAKKRGKRPSASIVPSL